VSGRRAAVALGAAIVVLVLPTSLAAADSFTPITVSLSYTPVARLHAKFRVTARITADPGVLDIASQPVRIGVKLAAECGGDYEHTSGPAVLNKHLNPQPATGRAYSATISGWGRPSAYGVQTLCMSIEDSVGRVYADDESDQVDVSQPCTTAGNRYDTDNQALKRAQRRLRRAHARSGRRRWKRAVARDRRTLDRDRRKGVAACGRGVAL
jgi:hypothetical protein